MSICKHYVCNMQNNMPSLLQSIATMNSPFNSIPFSEFPSLAPNTPVKRFAGVLQKVYAPKRGQHDLNNVTGRQSDRGVIQNIFVRDPFTQDEVKVMLIDHYISPAEYEGGYIAFEALTDGAMSWKPQMSRGKPFPPKLEVTSTVEVKIEMRKGQYKGPKSLPADSASQETLKLDGILPAATPRRSAPPPRPSKPIQPDTTPEQSVANVVKLARMTIEGMAKELAQIPAVEVTAKPVSESLFEHLVLSAFVQLTKDGVHHTLASNSEAGEPAPELRPEVERLRNYAKTLPAEVLRTMLRMAGVDLTTAQIELGDFDGIGRETIEDFLFKAEDKSAA